MTHLAAPVPFKALDEGNRIEAGQIPMYERFMGVIEVPEDDSELLDPDAKPKG